MAQKSLILRHLERYGSITPMTALEKYGCFRLAARIGELKDQGHEIATEMVKKGQKRYAKYRLVA